MNTNDLELYYFSTAPVEDIRFKYFPEIKKIVNADNFFNNQKLSSKKRISIRAHMAHLIMEYIKADKYREKEFCEAYGLKAVNLLCEYVLECVVADEAIKQKRTEDIFIDKSSVLCLDGEYPPNVRDWHKDKSITILKACETEQKLYELFNSVPAELIFGEEFVKKANEKIRKFKEKKKKKENKHRGKKSG